MAFCTFSKQKREIVYTFLPYFILILYDYWEFNVIRYVFSLENAGIVKSFTVAVFKCIPLKVCSIKRFDY